MFGCIGGFFRLVLVIVLLAVLGGGAYYYLTLHPEKAPWKGGVASVREKVATATLGAEVKAALSLRQSLNNLEIDVSAEKDVVTLRGRVPRAELSKTAENITSSVPGVRQVVNFLEVDPKAGRLAAADDRSVGERVDDEALELKIRAAFKLDKELVDAGFKIEAVRRVVTLSSSVANPEQKKRALSVARSVEGVNSAEIGR